MITKITDIEPLLQARLRLIGALVCPECGTNLLSEVTDDSKLHAEDPTDKCPGCGFNARDDIQDIAIHHEACRQELFGLAYPLEAQKVRSMEFLRTDEALEETPTVWPEFAAHLLGVDDLGLISLVQDDDPNPDPKEFGVGGAISDHWSAFREEKRLPDDTGYSMIALGTVYDVPAVAFHDTGYSAFLFRTTDVAKWPRPERVQEIEAERAKFARPTEKGGS